MRRRANYLLMVLMIAMVNFGFSNIQSHWNKVPLGNGEMSVRKIFITTGRAVEVWVGTQRSVYKIVNVNGHYISEALTGGVTAAVNDMLDDDGTIYLATDEGLYMRAAKDYHFKRIFSSSDELQRQCLTIARVDGKFYLGTRKGLLTKGLTSASWEVFRGELSSALIQKITDHGNMVYVLNSKSIFKIDPANDSYTEIFTVGLSHEVESDEEIAPDDQSALSRESIVDFKMTSSGLMYAATQEGVYSSGDSGKTWNILVGEGLPYKHLRRLLIKEKDGDPVLFAATDDGVYQYAQARWEPVYQGLESNKISDLAQDDQGRIYAATDRGLFILTPKEALASIPPVQNGKNFSFNNYDEIEQYFAFEPTIRDVQEMAVEYAEVHPNKIKQWRKQAQMQALAPSLSTGLNRSATDKYHWDTGLTPDALIKGREYLDWDVGLSWNLGNLIWNDDQTSIDSRSKLMVELREDVIDQEIGRAHV